LVFIRYASLVYIVKMTPIILSIEQRKNYNVAIQTVFVMMTLS